MDEIKQDFLESLQDLTINSKPLILSLTSIAQDYTQYAAAVCDAVEEHILNCPLSMKLPAVYVMDSICKNIRVPYADIFASKVYRILTAVFQPSPEPIRMKLGELFKTWTQPQADTGEPLFPHEILGKIDSFFGRQSSSAKGPPAPPQGNPRSVNQSVLLVEINKALKQVTANPINDRDYDYRVSALNRLLIQMSSSAVDPKQLPAIQQQLDNVMSRQRRKRSSRESVERGPRRFRHDEKPRRRQEPSNWQKHVHGPPPEPDQDLDLEQDAMDLESDHESSVANESNETRPPVTQAESAPIESLIPSSLLSTLKSAGLLSRQPLVELSNNGISSPRPDLIRKLYNDLPLLCHGKRYQDTPDGRAARERELDRRFRINQSKREGHFASRCWLLPAEEWISYRDDEVAEGREATPIVAPIVDFASESKKFVVAPAQAEDTHCLVCNDKFNTVWNEDVEDWVWMNAVCVDGHYLNATCYADPQNADAVTHIFEKASADAGKEQGELKEEVTQPPLHVKAGTDAESNSDASSELKQE